MKKILLSSAAIVAFAGAAAAEVDFSGSAKVTFQDGAFDGADDGVHWEAGLSVTYTQELNNGWTAGATFGVDIADDTLGLDLESTDFVVFVESDMGGLYFGDTDTAAEINYSAPKALNGAEETDFDTVVADDDTDGYDAVIRLEGKFAGVSVAASSGIDSNQAIGTQLSASGEFGSTTVSLAYQDADHDGLDGDGDVEFLDTQAIALAVVTTFGGADVSFGYQNSDSYGTSAGVGVSYTTGPATIGAYYTSNSDYDNGYGLDISYDVSDMLTLGASYDYTSGGDTEWEITAAYDAAPITVDFSLNQDSEWAVEGSYTVSDDFTLFAGILYESDTAMYLGAEYDLGGGASFTASWADDPAVDHDDEIGAQDYDSGITLSLALEF